MRIQLSFVLIAQLLPLPIAAQQDSGFKISTTTQLVVVNVSAKDKSGNPIDGLKAEDFTVTEDGKTQRLQVFEYQHLEDVAMPALELKARTTTAATPTAPAAITPTKGNNLLDNSLCCSFLRLLWSKRCWRIRRA